jgi:hypothetical protein
LGPQDLFLTVLTLAFYFCSFFVGLRVAASSFGILQFIFVTLGFSRMRLAGHVTRMGEKRNAYGILVGKPEGKQPLGRLRSRWVGNIKIDLREIGWNGMDWIDLAQDRDQWRALVNTVMNLRVP